MNDQKISLVKSLPALLALTGGMALGSAKAASVVRTETDSQQPIDAKIKNLSTQLNTTPGIMALEPGKADTGGLQTFWWGNWHNGWGPGMWRNGGWGNGGFRNWHNGWGNGFRNY